MDTMVLFTALEIGLSNLKSDLKKVSAELKAEITKLANNTKQQLAELRLCSTTVAANDNASKTGVSGEQHRQQRARTETDSIPVLANNEVIHTVFSFVGIGEYYFVADVCRNWRGRYLQLCSQNESNKTNKFVTSRGSIMTTAARLQLALDNGLTIDKLDHLTADWLGQEKKMLVLAVIKSLEPIAVLSLARVYGLQWCSRYADYAAYSKMYVLLKWLLKCGCPCDLAVIARDAIRTYDVEHMTKVRAITGPWPTPSLSAQLTDAAMFNKLDTVKWLREQGAAWPERFTYAYHGFIWSLKCVQWARTKGSGWLVWRCQDLALQEYICGGTGDDHNDDDCSSDTCTSKHAMDLFKWAHENGCPCTCNEPAAAAV
jgi:hypothetical protein